MTNTCVGVRVVLDGPAAGTPDLFLLRRKIMTEHARSLSERTGLTETRATEAGLAEVELSELQAVSGGLDTGAWQPKLPVVPPGYHDPNEPDMCGTKPRPLPYLS
jgi:hypothetical protein